jgi:methylenetetrahydrofolate dehydrogenase (NADP+)/methenyltetrahydrofolate cyclohydrolase
MILLDGKTLSQKILSELKDQIKMFGKKINLDIILVGNDESSQKYVALKQQRASEVGISGKLHQLSQNSSESEIINLINKLNNDSTITGFFVQLPLPKNIHKNIILNSINPHKDADGLVFNSPITPAVVRGIIHLLDEYKLNFVSKNIVIVNDSQLIGQPLKKHFESRHSLVTLCNQSTNNLTDVTKTADLLISATGSKNLITADMVKQDAVVIDVGSGDVDFENVSKIASYITPTFGGVGPMTVVSLLQNTFELAVNS